MTDRAGENARCSCFGLCCAAHSLAARVIREKHPHPATQRTTLELFSVYFYFLFLFFVVVVLLLFFFWGGGVVCLFLFPSQENVSGVVKKKKKKNHVKKTRGTIS